MVFCLEISVFRTDRKSCIAEISDNMANRISESFMDGMQEIG